MNPITLRQTLQTADIEALREAMGSHGLQVREAAQKKVLDDRTTLEQNNVAQIPQAEATRTEERKGRGRQGQESQGRGAKTGEGTSTDGTGSALTADSHVDFLI